MRKVINLLLVMVLIFSNAYGETNEIQNHEEKYDVRPTAFSFLDSALLDIGSVVCAKMKSLAAGVSVEYYTPTEDIKAIRMADALPAEFHASDANTISMRWSPHPVYIFFDDQDDAGIMYVYSGDYPVVMNSDSRYAFCVHSSLKDLSGLFLWDAGHVVTLEGMFLGDSSLEMLHGLENWDTANVRYMSSLFSGAEALTDASALSHWNTSAVRDMSFMFSENISLPSIDVSQWNTSSVENMTSMFQVGYSGAGNGALTEIRGLENWDVSNVVDMTCMFYGAGHMTHYNISSWDVSKVQSFNHMFCDNFTLEELDLSDWNVQNVKTMYDMFDDAYQLTTIGDVSHWNTSNLVDIGGWLNMAHSFVGNQGTLDLSGWDTGNLKVTGEAFRDTALEIIDLSNWTFDSVINGKWHGAGRGIYYEYGNQYSVSMGMNGMFKESKKLRTVFVSQSGLDSFHVAARNGVNVEDMWTGTLTDGFTLK